MNESNEKLLILKVSFNCLYADDFEVDIELIDENRMQGLADGWVKAIKHYCPHDVRKMQKQLKRKLGPIYNFHDLSDVVLRYMNADGKRDEVRVSTNYAMISSVFN